MIAARQATFADFPIEIIQEQMPIPKSIKKNLTKRSPKKPLYVISIESVLDVPVLIKMGYKYIAHAAKQYGDYYGGGGGVTTKQEAIDMILHYISKWQKFDSILGRDPDPVTKRNLLFKDETGDFLIDDFFYNGLPKIGGSP
ncbi:MAG: hypothetical protein WC455_21690 [Dehalococcoidia bacterium]|jgi:hypothetical protein